MAIRRNAVDTYPCWVVAMALALMLALMLALALVLALMALALALALVPSVPVWSIIPPTFLHHKTQPMSSKTQPKSY